MKKMVFGVAIMMYVILAFGGSASAQQVGGVNCDQGVGYGDVCPDDVERANDAGVNPSGTLPRTGDDSSLPLAKAAIVLIGVGGAMTIMANRKRLHSVPA